jgi:hypothetical protein
MGKRAPDKNAMAEGPAEVLDWQVICNWAISPTHTEDAERILDVPCPYQEPPTVDAVEARAIQSMHWIRCGDLTRAASVMREMDTPELIKHVRALELALSIARHEARQ